ncbi:RagB/SusD family nutrient uptake outer membrane protein [Pedobacter sp. MW01-1-1]|uniref:RagB/SusD family nutrient uptake outer membrane protein n=1 Tax=Pedobacter sp. MW01-1-1 TaxID=3383027 RepID=UPI003FEF51C4
MKNTLFYIVACATLFLGCNKYLDVEPKGFQIPSKIEDFELMLTSNNIIQLRDYVLYDSADDIYYASSARYPSAVFDNTFSFQKDIYPNGVTQTHLWDLPYAGIYSYNTILESIDQATGSNLQKKATIKAEALLGRAYNYWSLVNTFAKHYDSRTASSDMGVPILTKADVNQSVPARSSVQAVYDLILQDVLTALPNLPSVNKSYRATKASAYGFLARIYLYQGKYADAKQAADNALMENSYLANYTAVNASTTLALKPFFDQEQTYNRAYTFGSYTPDLTYYALHPEFIALFEAGDMRPQFFFSSIGPTNQLEVIIAPILQSNGISVPEIYLTRAECNARLNQLQAAVDDVNMLRKNRINPANYSNIAVTNANDVLTKVLEERRRELFLSGNRFFDLKRLNKDPRFAKDVEHMFNSKRYVLKPNSVNYVMPIPYKVIQSAPALVQNEREVISPL